MRDSVEKGFVIVSRQLVQIGSSVSDWKTDTEIQRDKDSRDSHNPHLH